MICAFMKCKQRLLTYTRTLYDWRKSSIWVEIANMMRTLSFSAPTAALMQLRIRPEFAWTVRLPLSLKKYIRIRSWTGRQNLFPSTYLTRNQELTFSIVRYWEEKERLRSACVAGVYSEFTVGSHWIFTQEFQFLN